MSTLQRRDGGSVTAPIGRMFDEWFRTLPVRRPPWMEEGEDLISVDEYRDGATQVIRAEIPGIDPEKDVELTVKDGTLRIAAERRVEQDTEDKGYTRHELRYGSFARVLPLAEGATESDITAVYRDGILEIRVPVAEPAPDQPATTIPVTKG